MEEELIYTDQDDLGDELDYQSTNVTVLIEKTRLDLREVTDEPSGGEFDEFVEQHLTSEANNEMLMFNQDSPFHKEREALGIANVQEEKPFEIKVLDIADADWREKTGNPASFAFVPSRGESSKPIIFISKSTYMIIKSGRSFWGEQDLLHEYRHTQRSWEDESGKLYPLLDEIAADQTAAKGSRPYIADTLLIHWLCEVDEQLDPAEIYRAYKAGNLNQMQNFLDLWRSAYSEEGLALLAEFKPGSQTDGAQAVEFWESLLTLKERKDPTWLTRFESTISSAPDKARKITFSGFFRRIERAIASSTATRVKAFMEVLERTHTEA